MKPRRRGWYRYYLVFVALLVLAFAVAGYLLFRDVSRETWQTLHNTYFNPDAAARV